MKHKPCFSLVPINFFMVESQIIKSSADFWHDEWVKDGRKEVAEKDEEAKIKKKLKKCRRHPPRRNSAPDPCFGQR